MHSKLFGERAWQIILKSSKEQQRNLWYLLAPNLKLTLQKGIVSSVVLISPLQQLCTVVFINVGVLIWSVLIFQQLILELWIHRLILFIATGDDQYFSLGSDPSVCVLCLIICACNPQKHLCNYFHGGSGSSIATCHLTLGLQHWSSDAHMEKGKCCLQQQVLEGWAVCHLSRNTNCLVVLFRIR